MKKRKPPVVLASILVVLVGVAVIFNMPKNQDPNAPQTPEQKQDEAKVGESRQTPSKENLAKQIDRQSQMREQMDPSGPKPDSSGNAKMATIFLPKTNIEKPKPNDASVQGQWYRPDARAARKDGFN